MTLRTDALAGRLDQRLIVSELLKDNPLGDPHERPLWVYTPPGYDPDGTRRYPVVYVLQAYCGTVTDWANQTPYTRPFPETADQVFARDQAPPTIVVYVDAWSAYGGSQYVDSPGTGRYHSYLCDEVVRFVDHHYRTLAEPAHRAVSGKSAGGFGAMITPMLRPDLFGALATHAGDGLYEYGYLPVFAQAVRFLRAYDGDIFSWWAGFQRRPPWSRPEDMLLGNVLGVSACFSAAEDGTPMLPFKPHSGELIPETWQRWLDRDPVRMAAGHAAELRGMRGIWIDSGRDDDFLLDLAAEAFHDAVLEAGADPGTVRFELFDGTHARIDYRYPMALAWLAERIAP
ncbi:alpha/beta hydrolase [Nonomuraea diastatica]|uniref:Enterochelin esterase n=1 Tax=Nonomuraea diastatica TaxID=1848329 RepID=A0A4R4W939_9ACTN|nr:alpha/beta hydrolase-fold protein [Nonomuraea diastatica]TDD14601.1 enterochelin esterase [Nonomuraea diastatica]